MPKIHSIGHRLFLSTALILLTTIAATLLFGSSLIERYYVHNEEVELKHAYQSFSLAFNRNESLPDWKTAGEVLYDAEKRNINVMLFTIAANGNIDQLIDFGIGFASFPKADCLERNGQIFRHLCLR